MEQFIMDVCVVWVHVPNCTLACLLHSPVLTGRCLSSPDYISTVNGHRASWPSSCSPPSGHTVKVTNMPKHLTKKELSGMLTEAGAGQVLRINVVEADVAKPNHAFVVCPSREAANCVVRCLHEKAMGQLSLTAQLHNGVLSVQPYMHTVPRLKQHELYSCTCHHHCHTNTHAHTRTHTHTHMCAPTLTRTHIHIFKQYNILCILSLCAIVTWCGAMSALPTQLFLS